MAEITFHDDVRNGMPRKLFLTEKRWLLFIYVPIFVSVCSILGIIFEEHKGFSLLIDIALALGLNVFELMWCRMDSRERGYALHRHFTFAVVIFGVLALLYYLFRSREFRVGLISTGWLVLYVVALVVVSSVVSGLAITVLILAGAVSPSVVE
jgi:hypothetical protein